METNAPDAKEIHHILRNKSQCLKGAAKEIERLGKLSCNHCRYKVYEELLNLAKNLKKYGKELDDLSSLF